MFSGFLLSSDATLKRSNLLIHFGHSSGLNENFSGGATLKLAILADRLYLTSFRRSMSDTTLPPPSIFLVVNIPLCCHHVIVSDQQAFDSEISHVGPLT